MVCRVVVGSPGGLRDGDLAGFASKTVGTQAVIVIDAVIALCPIFAWLAGAVVDVDGAETSFKAHLALAGEAVDPIMAGSTVGTGTHQTVIHIILTESPHKASKAPAGEVAGKAVVILTLSPILAWRPEWREQGQVMALEIKQKMPHPRKVNTQLLACPVGPAPALTMGQLSQGEDRARVSISPNERLWDLLKGCGSAQAHHPPGRVFSQI